MKKIVMFAILAIFLGTALPGCIILPEGGGWHHHHDY